MFVALSNHMCIKVEINAGQHKNKNKTNKKGNKIIRTQDTTNSHKRLALKSGAPENGTNI